MTKIHKLSLLQITGWLISFVLFTAYLRQRMLSYEWEYILGISISAFLSFAVIIYGYTYYLYPRFFSKARRLPFTLIVIGFFFVVVAARMILERKIVANLTEKGNFFYFGKAHFLYDVISVFIALMIAVMLKITLESLVEEKNREQLKRAQLETEMKLLKSQLQPHFIFNSLNNIYYEAYKEAPAVAVLIQKLSDLMRYMVSEASRDRVPVQTEIQFLHNYIHFENLRLRYEVPVVTRLRGDQRCLVPPLLVLTFIENAFKHGVDKTSNKNRIEIDLSCENGFFSYKVVNTLTGNDLEKNTGIGLKNLEERLKLLYGNQFELNFEKKSSEFHAYLKVPV
ncbi:MAG TPA: histidine kinase [Chitinophagaceae bacterium]|nr:histidine kinase [Chitinophagaceae bacterium]